LDPSDELFNAGRRVGKALADGGRSGLSVEEIFADVNADPEAAQGRELPKREDEATRTDGFPVRAGECGVGPQ
jgi:hypothetical protein